MEHAKDIELIELAAERLAEAHKQAVLRHLQGCPRCRDKLAGIQRTWTVLGAWDVSEAASGRSGRTASLSPRARTARSARVVRFPGFGAVVRVAAAVVVAAVIGYVGGQRTAGEVSDSQQSTLDRYVSVLGLDVGGSFSSLVFDEPSADKEGGA